MGSQQHNFSGTDRPSTVLINSARSASSSAYFAACFDAEMEVRRKETNIDLVVLEFGINDVWPMGAIGAAHFEKLIRRLRQLDSSPAIIILEAASLTLARSKNFSSSPDFVHLPVAKSYDIPLLSVKPILFDSPLPTPQRNFSSRVQNLFFSDQHHFNAEGHKLMAHVLTSYLEQAIHRTKEEKFLAVGEKLDGEVPANLPYSAVKTPRTASGEEVGVSRCMLIGNKRSKVQPLTNTG